MFNKSDVKTILPQNTEAASMALGFHNNFIIEFKRAFYRIHTTDISFGFGQEQQIRLSPFILAPMARTVEVLQMPQQFIQGSLWSWMPPP